MIKTGTIVNLSFSLKNSDGRLLDQSDARDPLVYLHGASQIVPGLEVALEGLKVGDKKSVIVSAAEGYGEKDPALQLVVPRAQFPKDVELEVGMQFEAKSQDGHGAVFTVASVDGEQVNVDGNHPLAGEALHFDVEVLAVRDATPEELEECGDDACGCDHDHDHGHTH
jgi:FKBP-type peptidyl-prolyl cis-trans isomerase SlyD